MTASAASTPSFSPRLIAGVVAVGVVAFIALWALIALGPQTGGGNDSGGHALSKAAPGYAGIIDLLDRSGADVTLRRSTEARYGGGRELLILTPTRYSNANAISDLIRGHRGGPVLIILPKWLTGRHPDRTGWAGPGQALPPPRGLLPPLAGRVERIDSEPHAAGATAVGRIAGRPIALPLPGLRTQLVTGDGLRPLIPFPHGGILVGKFADGIYLISDPDFLNNFAFASPERARAAAMLVDAIADDANADRIAFDVTLNGFGSQRSLLRFAFVPPFIGITLCLIAAGLLALWQAWMRFGPALRPGRAIPVSKAALIANSADLIKQARREIDGAAAYVRSQRSAIARRLHAPAGLDEAATDRWIDKHLAGGGARFSELAQRLPRAQSTHEFLADAQALHDIRKDLLRDS